MAHWSQTRVWEGWGSALESLLVAVESDSWCADPTPLWTFCGKYWEWLRGLLALSASCVFPLRLYASLSRTYHWPFLLMSANCLGLMFPSAVTGKWFPPVLSLQLFGEHHDRASFSGFAEEDFFGHLYIFHPCHMSSPAQQNIRQNRFYSGQVWKICT